MVRLETGDFISEGPTQVRAPSVCVTQPGTNAASAAIKTYRDAWDSRGRGAPI